MPCQPYSGILILTQVLTFWKESMVRQPGLGRWKWEALLVALATQDYKAWVRWPSGFCLAEMNGCCGMVENLLLYMLIKLKKRFYFLKV